MELRNAVNARFGVELPATVTFDYPTVAAMAGFLASQMIPQEAAPPLQSTLILPEAGTAAGNITHIVGLSSVMATPGSPDCGLPCPCSQPASASSVPCCPLPYLCIPLGHRAHLQSHGHAGSALA